MLGKTTAVIFLYTADDSAIGRGAFIMATKNNRIDHRGSVRGAFEKNKKRILKTQSICGICGKPVDKSIAWPNPMSATVDHIIPISRGGHPFDMDNLQLAHFCCNRAKSNNITSSKAKGTSKKDDVITNRNLPQSIDWTKYRG